MYGMFVHIKAVTYVTSDREVQEEMSNTYIFLMYAPIMFVMYYLAN